MNSDDRFLVQCRECRQHFRPAEVACPHCGASRDAAIGSAPDGFAELSEMLGATRAMYGPVQHSSLRSVMLPPGLTGQQFIVARALLKSTRAGELLDGDEDPIGQIRVSPRIVWGCLTVLVSVVLFFGLPVLVGWLLNQLLILMGTSLQNLLDRNLAVGIPLIIMIVATGILGAMSAAWSLYRQKWRLVDNDQQPILTLVETRKYGAASLTVSVRMGDGQEIGTVHRDVWGRMTLSDADGQERLRLMPEGTIAGHAVQQGTLAVISGAVAFATAVLLGGVVVPFFKTRGANYHILPAQSDPAQTPLSAGNLLPMEPRAYRIRFTSPLIATDKTLVMAAGIILTMYDL